MIKKILLILLTILASQVQAQYPGVRGTVFRNGFGAVADDYSVGYWNPAGMLNTKHWAIGAMVHQLSLDRQFGFVGGILSLNRFDRLGVSYSGLVINNLEARQGNTVDPDFHFSNVEHHFGLSYSRILAKRLSGGIGCRFLYHNLNNVSASGYQLDIGLLYIIKKEYRLALVGRDLLSHLKWQTGLAEKFDRGVCLSGSYYTDAVILGIGIEVFSKNNLVIGIGSEFKVIDYFTIKAGIQQNRLVAGLGFDFRINGIDWKIQFAIMNSHIISGLTHLGEFEVTR